MHMDNILTIKELSLIINVPINNIIEWIKCGVGPPCFYNKKRTFRFLKKDIILYLIKNPKRCNNYKNFLKIKQEYYIDELYKKLLKDRRLCSEQ